MRIAIAQIASAFQMILFSRVCVRAWWTKSDRERQRERDIVVYNNSGNSKNANLNTLKPHWQRIIRFIFNASNLIAFYGWASSFPFFPSLKTLHTVCIISFHFHKISIILSDVRREKLCGCVCLDLVDFVDFLHLGTYSVINFIATTTKQKAENSKLKRERKQRISNEPNGKW